MITVEDLEAVDEPCKSCSLIVFDDGNEKTFYCNDKMAQLIKNPDTKKFSQIPYCPKVHGNAYLKPGNTADNDSGT